MAKTVLMSKEDKKKAKLFYTRSLPILIISIIVGLGGIQIIKKVMEGSIYLRIALYIWIIVFFAIFMVTNRIALARAQKHL